jgi:Probable zinc-ribbon domain
VTRVRAGKLQMPQRNEEAIETAEGQLRTCVECGEPFTVDVGEQRWLHRKGFELPKRCRSCRSQRSWERTRARTGAAASGQVRKARPT